MRFSSTFLFTRFSLERPRNDTQMADKRPKMVQDQIQLDIRQFLTDFKHKTK